MKQYFQYVMMLYFIGISSITQAQDKKIITKEYEMPSFYRTDGVKEDIDLPNNPAINVFLEIGGASLTGATYIDSRFSKKRDGMGMSIGTGYSKYKGKQHYSFPIQFNYLKRLKNPTLFFEIGGGVTFHNYGIFKNLFSLLGGIDYNQHIIQNNPQTYGMRNK